MQIKSGVLLNALSPQMVLGAMIVNSIFLKYSVECTITSGSDSTHGDSSLHYRGNALDFRTKNFVGNKTMLAEEVRYALGANYDVVLEALDKDNEHLHVEYQPKGDNV